MATSDKGLKPVILALPSLSPSLAVEVLPFGLTIHKILINGDGKTHDLLIGPDDKQEHQARRAFFHTIVGRYANRIPAGEHVLERDGVISNLSIAATESPEVSLHGGADGFDRRVFQVVPTTETSSYHLFSDAEKAVAQLLPASTVFKLTSPAGDQGYPGALDVEVLLALTEPSSSGAVSDGEERELGSLIIVYRARLAEGQAKTLTPVNLTQHWGFNLDASLAASPGVPTPDVMQHELTIKASKSIALKENGLATGELIAVAGTPYEHNGKPIAQDFPVKGYDEYYLFDSPSDATPSHVPLSSLATLDVLSPLTKASGDASEKEEAPVVLASKRSGIRLSFETNQPGVQLYTANGLTGAGTRKRIHGGPAEAVVGDGYQPGAATFLEFHEPLAAWQHPWGEAPGKDTLLTSDALYNNYTKVKVYFKPVAAEQ